MHTKGKAELSKLFTPTDSEPSCHIEIDGKVYFSTVSGNDVANAERLVTCWNEYDTLKAKLYSLELENIALRGAESAAIQEINHYKAKAELFDEAVGIIELLDGAGLNPITSLQLEKCRKASDYLSKAKEL